jgi:hypothetical protein
VLPQPFGRGHALAESPFDNLACSSQSHCVAKPSSKGAETLTFMFTPCRAVCLPTR